MFGRRLKKAAAVIVLAVFTLMTMCSCLAMEAGLIFNKDGTVRTYTDITMEEGMLETMEMTREDFIQSLQESSDSEEYEGWEQEAVETIVDGSNYIGLRYYKDISYEELNEMHDDNSGAEVDYNVVEEGGKLKVTVTFTGSATSEEESSDMAEYITSGMMTTTFRIAAPYEILDTNGTISEDSTYVTWDILDVMMGEVSEKTLTVEFKKGVSPLLALIIVGAVMTAAIVVIVLVVVSKNKKPQLTVSEYVPPVQTDSFAEPAAPVQPEAPAEASAEAPAEAPAAEEEEYNYDEVKTYCRNCGNQVGDSDAFCQNCGEPVTK